MTETAAEENTGSLEIQARVAEIASLLRDRAPNVGPNVAPRPYKLVVSNMLALCATAKQREHAEVFLSCKAAELAARRDGVEAQKNEQEEKEAADEGEGGEEWGRHVVVKTETDIATRTFRITGAKVRLRRRLPACPPSYLERVIVWGGAVRHLLLPC